MEPVNVLALAIILVTVAFVTAALKIVKEHEQGVVTRFGRFHAVLPPGLQLIVPHTDKLRRVDLRSLAVEERIDPASGTGMVRVFDESWPAQSSDGEPIGPGTPIKVVRLEGKYVVVAKTF